MKDMADRYVLHPFFMAVYPVLFLLSINVSQIPLQQAIRPLLISLSIALILVLLLGFAAKDFRQAGLTVTTLLALFFTYGHVYRWLGENIPILASHKVLGITWAILFVFVIVGKYRIHDIGNVTKYLNIILLFLLLMPLFNIGRYIYQSGIAQDIKPPSPFENIQPLSPSNNELPDVYYIILDAYGRSDVVQELYGYDNSSFISYLKRRGFYVAGQSRSNYIQTALSLSSSMNLNYLGNIEGTEVRSEDRDPLTELIHHSELRKFLEGQGYQTVTFATGYGPTTIDDSDVFIPYKANIINNLEGLILTTSATSAMGDKMQNLFIPFWCDVQRGGILNIFENLKKVPKLSGPKFVFAHISSPHPPFVFDSNGNAVKYGDCNGLDGNLFNGSKAEYLSGYPQQMAYISQMTQEVIDTILENSVNPPIIIIQGDHGSGLYLDWNSPENSCLRERTSILNAYYIPMAMSQELYETITPVNTFRVVFNEAFGLRLPLLEDKNYYSPWDKPYQVEDITDDIEASCTAGK
jgi:hypothetical protein